MIKKLKDSIQNCLNRFGYEMRSIKTDDLDVYKTHYGKNAIQEKAFYNIGAGDFRHPAWTNVDHDSDWYKGVQGDSISIDWDLLSLTPIRVEDNTAKIVYSSHTIEHITNDAAQNLFNEAYRILEPGGIIRLTTPNINLDYKAYKNNDRHYYYWISNYSNPQNMDRAKFNTPFNKASLQQIFLTHFATSASELHIDGAKERISDKEVDRVFKELSYEEALDHCLSKCDIEVQKKYPGNHINWWNIDKATRMLSEAGFKDIYQSGHGQSAAPVLRNTLLFDNTHPKISLYVEAIK